MYMYMTYMCVSVYIITDPIISGSQINTGGERGGGGVVDGNGVTTVYYFSFTGQFIFICNVDLLCCHYAFSLH